MIIRDYLPRQMTETEVEQAVAAAIEETGACLDPRHGQGHGDCSRRATPARWTSPASAPRSSRLPLGAGGRAAARGRDPSKAGRHAMKKRLFGRDESGRAVEEVDPRERRRGRLHPQLRLRRPRLARRRPARQPADGARLPPPRGLPAPFPLARRHRRPGRQPHRRARPSPSTARPTQLTAERRAEPPARRRHRARQADLGRWRPTAAANTLHLFYHSPDGEEGYPGDRRLQRRPSASRGRG